MAEETKIEGIVSEQKTRRTAIKTAAQVAVTAPAVGLLLSAGTKTAQAYVHIQSPDNFGGVTTADDFTATNGAAGAGTSDDATFDVAAGDDLYSF